MAGTIIITGSIWVIMVIHFSGCGIIGLGGETMSIFDDAVISTYVTTTPSKAKVNLINIDRSVGAAMSTTFAPTVVHYVPLPRYGAYLVVSKPGYKKRIVRLNSEEETIHVTLELEDEKQQKEETMALVGLSVTFGPHEHLPDLTYIHDKESIPELIDHRLAENIEFVPPAQ